MKKNKSTTLISVPIIALNVALLLCFKFYFFRMIYAIEDWFIYLLKNKYEEINEKAYGVIQTTWRNRWRLNQISPYCRITKEIKTSFLNDGNVRFW